jgi:putative ABC transport system substrate-binding protein
MKRRDFITLLGGAAAAWPIAAHAQQTGLPVIGYLNGASADLSEDRLRGFRQGLGDTGYVEGRNAAIEFRWANGQYDRLPAMAADLVRRNVAVIIATGVPVALAAKAATTTIPIVFSTAGDPVALGLIASLRRPGGNLTGVTNLSVEVGPKQLELLHEMVPAAMVVALLVNPSSPLAETTSDLQAATSALGLELRVLPASNDREIDTAFASLAQLRAGALLIGSDAFFNTRTERLAALVVRHAIPAITGGRDFVAAGGLMGYGGSDSDFYRQIGVYAGRILKGDKPADLPVQQSSKVELFINLKAAKALGLAVPITLLGRADEVIE